MKTFYNRIAFVAMILMAFFVPVSGPAMAQEEPETTVEAMPIAIVTEEAAGPSIVCENGATCNLNEAPTDETSAPADNSIWGIILAILVVGVGLIVAVSYGFQAVGNRAQTAVNNPLEMAVIEKAYESISPTVLTTVVEPLKEALERSNKALQSVIELLNKAGDKIPEADKAAAATAKPSTPYPPASGHDLGLDLTTGPKPDPTRPAFDGGAPTGSTGFPRGQ